MKLILSLIFLLFLPGYLVIRISKGGKPPSARPGRRAWLQAAVASVALSSWAGLLLLECGLFSLTSLLLVLGVFSAALYLVFRPPLRGGAGARAPLASRNWPLFLILGAFAAACFHFGPSEYVFGGWDSGEYVNMGALFENSGKIVYRDDFFASVPEGDRMLFTQNGRRYMGFNLPDAAGAVVSPKFMHVYPMWLAVAKGLGGLRAALSLNIFVSLLSICLCYRIAAGLGGRGAAPAAAFLMAASALQLWFARAQCAEPLAQLFFLGGVYFWLLWQRDGSRGAAPLSALCLGMMILTKIDSLIVLLCLVPALLTTRRKPGEGAFLLLLAAALVQTLAHLAWWDRPYAGAVIDNIPGARPWLIAVSGAAFIAGTAVALLLRRRGGASAPLPPRARIVSGAVLFSVILLAYFVRPAVSASPEASNLVELGRITGVGLFWFAAAALVWFWTKGLRDAERLLWFAALGVTTYFSLTLAGEGHLYPWSARRFLPVTLPAFAVFSGCLASRIGSLLPRRFRPTMVVAVAALGLAPVIRFPYLAASRDYPGGVEFVEKLCAATAGYDIVICEQPRFAVPLDFLCGRNVLLFHGGEQTPEKCDTVERLIDGWLRKGTRVAYMTAGPAVHGKFVEFREKDGIGFVSSVVPLARHDMPGGEAAVGSRITIFEAVAPEARGPGGNLVFEIDYNCFGLEDGFHRAKRTGRGGRVGRWTGPSASLIIPWSGDGSAREMVLSLSTGRRGGAEVPVRLSVEGKEIGTVTARGMMAEYRLPVPAGTAPGLRRVRLGIAAPAWDPADSGLSGYPSELGVFIDLIKVTAKNTQKQRHIIPKL